MRKVKLRSIAACLISLILLVLFACSSPTYQPVSTHFVSASLDDHSAIMADGYRLPVSRYLSNNAKAVVIALHGFNDYRNAFSPLCSYLAERNINCYSYDQRGFGETQHRGLWPSNGELQSDLITLSKLIKRKHPDLPLYVIGESMGGAVVMTTFAENNLPHVDGIALLAPAVWARHTQPWYQQLALWLSVRVAPGWKPTGEGFERTVTDNIDMLRALSRDPLVIKETRVDAIYGLTNLMDEALESAKNIAVRGIILYGDKDDLIGKTPTCEMLANIATSSGDWRFVLYKNGYHMLNRDLQAENVYQDLIQWIDNSPQPLDEELDLKNGEWQYAYCGT